MSNANASALSNDGRTTIQRSEGALAVLLPLTSRGVADPRRELAALAACLPGADECAVFVGVDADDPVYAEAAFEWSAVFGGRAVHVSTFEPARPARIWAIARALAAAACRSVSPRFEYFCLLGDDVRISPCGARCRWMEVVRREFERRSPPGFGVVALPDASFPGFPTFPVLGRAHFDIFGSDGLVPDVFVNQDGDPYLWEIYRRFGASTYAGGGILLRNTVGGDEGHSARYERVHVPWKSDVLRAGVDQVHRWLAERVGAQKAASMRTLALDVVVPSFRVPMERLRRIVQLPVPPRCDVQCIIVIDDPAQAGARNVLEQEFRERVRVRVNAANAGASASRNRGLDESSADWVIFIDDDVDPDPTIIAEYAASIREHGDRAAGFVGLTRLPRPTTERAAAVDMSYLTHFWGVARLPDGGELAPWGVTANVCARRTDVRFDLCFPKTGGGEDIDFLLRTVRETGRPLLKAPRAQATHPWWNGGNPPLGRFYGWAVGDALLIGCHPEHSFRSWPNAWELSLAVPALLAALGAAPALAAAVFLWLAELALDSRHLMVFDTAVSGHLRGAARARAAVVACVYKNACELGHLCVALRRGWLLRRFDWWCGISATYRKETRAREARRAAVLVAALVAPIALGADATAAAIAAGLASLLSVLALPSLLPRA